MESAFVERPPLFVGGSSLIRRLRLAPPGNTAVPVRNELRVAMTANAFLRAAPFTTVSVIVRYAETEKLVPELNIDAEAGALNVTVQLDGHALAKLSESGQREKFRTVLIDVLCDVAANYDLPYEFLDDMRHDT
jgi:hypothetical protein